MLDWCDTSFILLAIYTSFCFVCRMSAQIADQFCRHFADILQIIWYRCFTRSEADWEQICSFSIPFVEEKQIWKGLKPIQKIWKQLFFVTKYLKLIGPFFTSQPKQLNLIPRSSHLQLCCTFDIIGWLIAKFFQTWLTVAGYTELCVCFLPIGNGETFWMNNNVTYCALDKLVYLSDNFSIGPKPHNVSINSTKTFTELY